MNLCPQNAGHGVYTCADGDTYTGGWANDKRHGQGVMVYLSDDGVQKEKYEGEWCVIDNTSVVEKSDGLWMRVSESIALD